MKVIFYLFINYFSCDQAIKLNQKDDAIWNNKGYALNRLGKYQEAIDWWDLIIRLIINFNLASIKKFN